MTAVPLMPMPPTATHAIPRVPTAARAAMETWLAQRRVGGLDQAQI